MNRKKLSAPRLLGGVSNGKGTAGNQDTYPFFFQDAPDFFSWKDRIFLFRQKNDAVSANIKVGSIVVEAAGQFPALLARLLADDALFCAAALCYLPARHYPIFRHDAHPPLTRVIPISI
jgi:hypothetical protein